MNPLILFYHLQSYNMLGYIACGFCGYFSLTFLVLRAVPPLARWIVGATSAVPLTKDELAKAEELEPKGRRATGGRGAGAARRDSGDSRMRRLAARKRK